MGKIYSYNFLDLKHITKILRNAYYQDSSCKLQDCRRMELI